MIKNFWRRLNLNQKIVFPFLAVSLSILVVGVLMLGYWFTGSLEQSLQEEVESFTERVQQDFHHEWQELNSQLTLIATQDALRQAALAQDNIALSQLLVPLKASLRFDWVKVVNTEGAVLLDARSDVLNQAELSDTAISNSASAGANLTDLVLVDKTDQPHVLLAGNHPIKSERLLGGLIIGRCINDEMLQKIATGSSKQLVALANHQVIAKTLPDMQGLTAYPAVDAAAARIEVGNQHYLAKAFTLDGSRVSLSIFVLYPITALEAARTELWLRLGLLLLLGGTVVISVGVCIAGAIARPIRILIRMTQQLAQGDLSVRVLDRSQDEVGQLSHAFNQMAEQLAERGLLSQHIQQLQQTLGDLEKNQTQLIHAEKMSSLGQLVAGVAHEINTPLGAIQSSIGNITSALEQALKELPPLLQTLPPDQLSNFFTLLDWAQQPQEMLSSREERQLKRNIKQTLSEQGLLHASRLADTLSKMGVTAALDPILPLLQAADAPAILGTAHQLSIVQNNSRNIQLAVERASRTVYALKNYVRQDVVGMPVYAAVAEGIDTVLIIYQNQIKCGIEVEKRYASLPQLLCYPEELIQVWSNLISNAIQAMNYRGKLAIATSKQDEHIVVQIADTGSGISPEIKARIFEPFFTTKAMGEGTGLGLSIVKNIVAKHRGRIEVESTPGHTVFRVWLPLHSFSYTSP
ncbi:HAMP domain-containing protein [Oculatella sp. LEGE 06141]|uniref:sensor histidine kinase n=1 Tax=Oculatella sp. LEGE 06141 TaxID=1828648 RepID=UPI001882E129|nr:ATP-binding protein [Oculatella sp. LEGE 06141]MBE9178124.1 HAMP domain-containing protein [Oculatella sp. LEGE 06141]